MAGLALEVERAHEPPEGATCLLLDFSQDS